MADHRSSTEPGASSTRADRGAVIVAGGSGARMGGTDKPGLVAGGHTLLDIALHACASCAEIVVVGPHRPTTRQVTWTREEPAGSGPLAAVDAGMRLLSEHITTVTILAADLPFISGRAVDRLHDALNSTGADGAVLVDENGRRQFLTTVVDRGALATALHALGDVHDRPLRHLFDRLRLVDLPDTRTAKDVDVPADLALLTAKPHGGTSMTMDTFIAELCERLGVPVDDVDVNAILDLAKDVARGVERPAAPVATFVAGYAAAIKGGGTEALEEAVDTIAALAGEWADATGEPPPEQAPPLHDAADAETRNAGA
ncbi:NTP transferase domain-containing protein [Phytoactinopolyspora halophila]|nr:NTP transferase domain-containing protein [Phytoactinopolyspora halophila]